MVFHYIVEEHARRSPDKSALVMGDTVLTWSQVDSEAHSRLGSTVRKSVT